MSGDLNLPFEAGDGGELDVSDALLSGGVVVMATRVDLPDVGPMPGLVFRFSSPEGEFYPPILLITECDEMAGLVELVASAAATAVQAVTAAGG